jgi:hypothetical protein
MINLARLPTVAQTSGQTADQSITPVGGLQQQGSPIGTTLPLVKLHHRSLMEYLRKQQTLCCAIL